MREERDLAECKVCEEQTIAARDKEWVEWFESYCTEHEHIYPNHKRSECSKCWQERRKEIGI
jgi:hypothetical protein